MIVGSTCTANTKPNFERVHERAEDEFGADADEIEKLHESGRDGVEHIAAERQLQHQRREHQLQRDAAERRVSRLTARLLLEKTNAMPTSDGEAEQPECDVA